MGPPPSLPEKVMWYYEHPDNWPFLEAVRANPDDDLPRLVYADWLDEHPELRGAGWRARLIRDGCANHEWAWTCEGDSSVGLACSGNPVEGSSVCHSCELLYEAGVYWQILGGDGEDYVLRRGFLETATVHQFHGDEWARNNLDKLLVADPLPSIGLTVQHKRPVVLADGRLMWVGTDVSVPLNVFRQNNWFEELTQRCSATAGSSPVVGRISWENLLHYEVIARIINNMTDKEREIRTGWFFGVGGGTVGKLQRHNLVTYGYLNNPILGVSPIALGMAGQDLSKALVGLARDKLKEAEYATPRDEPVTVGVTTSRREMTMSRRFRDYHHRIDQPFNTGFQGMAGCLTAFLLIFLVIPTLVCGGCGLVLSGSRRSVDQPQKQVNPEEKDRGRQEEDPKAGKRFNIFDPPELGPADR